MTREFLYPLRRIHGRLDDLITKIKLRKSYQEIFKNNPKTVFLLNTPEHGNIGDHAIAQAETNFLENMNINYIEVSGHKLAEMKWANQLSVFNGFPILITGGGNLGTLWMDVENLQREIIQKNPKSKIILLPNTIFYEPSEWGQSELEKSTQIYNTHQSLSVYARELTSYNFMKPLYRKVHLAPDMVLSMSAKSFHLKRSGCLLCLRSDCEKVLTKEYEDIIRSQASQLFGSNVAGTDMVEDHRISIEKREEALSRKFTQFSKAELVITDRLHGMIFCAITETPCVVIDSKSPKLRGCYEWIKHLDYIRFANDPKNVVELYSLIPKGIHHYDNTHLQHYYKTLENEIERIWG